MLDEPDERPFNERLLELPGGRGQWLYVMLMGLVLGIFALAALVAGINGEGRKDAYYGYAIMLAVPSIGALVLSWRGRILAPWRRR